MLHLRQGNRLYSDHGLGVVTVSNASALATAGRAPILDPYSFRLVKDTLGYLTGLARGSEGFDLPASTKKRLEGIISNVTSRFMAKQQPPMSLQELLEVWSLVKQVRPAVSAFMTAEKAASTVGYFISNFNRLMFNPAKWNSGKVAEEKGISDAITTRLAAGNFPAITEDHLRKLWSLLTGIGTYSRGTWGGL